MEGPRHKGDRTFLYVEDVTYAPDLKDEVRAAFRAEDVNYIFEKELAPARETAPAPSSAR